MIERKSLRHQVFDAIQDRILDGRIRPGSSISEPGLSTELNVSRSPLREALLKLEGGGLVVSDVGRGFSVPPLDIDDVADTYVVLATLEGLALRVSSAPPTGALDQLDSINDRIERAEGQAKRLLGLDGRWHELLLRHCPNRRLMALVDDLRIAVRRYDYAYWRDAGDVRVSHDEHRSIVRTLRRPDMVLAEKKLVDHWIRGIEPVVRWLKELKQKGSS